MLVFPAYTVACRGSTCSDMLPSRFQKACSARYGPFAEGFSQHLLYMSGISSSFVRLGNDSLQ
jgi:hypothetical protein